jgi:hypothetical protein
VDSENAIRFFVRQNLDFAFRLAERQCAAIRAKRKNSLPVGRFGLLKFLLGFFRRSRSRGGCRRRREWCRKSHVHSH